MNVQVIPSHENHPDPGEKSKDISKKKIPDPGDTNPGITLLLGPYQKPFFLLFEYFTKNNSNDSNFELFII